MDSGVGLLIAVFLPIIGSVFLPLIGRYSERVRDVIAFLLIAISLGFSASLVPSVLSGQVVKPQIDFPLGGNPFQADMLAVFMALVSSFVGAIIVLYSIDYISHYENRGEYYFLVTLFLGAMMGLVYSNNLILLYVFWEITAFACWRLIGFFREDHIVLRADKAFLVTMFGSLVMLVGFFAVYHQAGSFDLSTIKEYLHKGNIRISDLAVLLILFGILSKSATLPLHTWLPDAGVAPTPVTALLHAAVLVKIGVYVYARLFVATFPIEEMWHTVVPIIAGVSALVSAGAALVENDMKRIIAYSTVSQLGFIFLGLSVGNESGAPGGMASEIGIAGGLLYILMHSLSKGGLFLCAGIVEQKTHTKDITKMGGLFSTMPLTAVSFLFCAFSVMGIPPLGGFFGKFMVITAAAKSGQVEIALLFVMGAILTMIYLLRLFTFIFLGESKGDLVKEGSPIMVGSVAALAIFSLVGGLLIQLPSNYVNFAVNQMLGIIK